jgi:hypothetical protein
VKKMGFPPRAALTLAFPVLLAPSARAAVTITDATDEGIECFKIATDTATYFYDKPGAGFVSILDRDGNDWIGFRKGGGASGHYRGIPNMGLNKFGHPGYKGATSTKVNANTIRSTKGEWSTTWEFFPTHAKMTVNGVGENYWFLYEGTPGGEVGADDVCWRSDGSKGSCSERWRGDVRNTSGAAPGTEWVYFADGKLDRSLFMIHNDDEVVDQYYLMRPMTVFGFGRGGGTKRHMRETPAVLIIGLVESRDFNAVKAHIDRVYRGAGQAPAGLGEIEELKRVAAHLEKGELGRALAAAERELESADQARRAEAERVVEELRKRAKEERERAAALKETSPLDAAEALEKLAGRYEGSDLGREFATDARRWKYEPAAQRQKRARRLLEMAEKAAARITGEGKATYPKFRRRYAREFGIIMQCAVKLRRSYAHTESAKRAEALAEKFGLDLPD